MVTVTQDVPVTVLTGSQIREITEPQVPAPDVRASPFAYLFIRQKVDVRVQVQIFLPQLKQLASVVERMTRVSDRLLLAANMSGELTLKVDSDVVSIATFYTKLSTPGTRVFLM